MAAPKRKVFLGTFIFSETREELAYLFKTALCVDERGSIVAVEKDCDWAKAQSEVLPKLGWSVDEVEVRASGEDEFFFPGLIGEPEQPFPV